MKLYRKQQEEIEKLSEIADDDDEGKAPRN